MANQYSADVPKGFNIPKQVRLDYKTGIQNEETLKNLGSGNSLAFTYYEGLEIYCKDEKTKYVWREVIGSETGLLDTHFIYPTYNPVDGINYSGKSFNFFEVTNSNIQPPDGSETKLIEGSNIIITGTGTIPDPYIISSISEISETYIEEGNNITITGTGVELDPYIINSIPEDLGIIKTINNEIVAPNQTLSIINNESTGKVLTTKEYVQSIIPSTPDGSETKLDAGNNITITGTGTTLDPYIINAETEESVTYINSGDNTNITGNGSINDPFIINSIGVQFDDLANIATTGEYSDLVNAPDTKLEFNSKLMDGDFLFVGDVTQYTNEQAQDAVGNILIDTPTINFTYEDENNTIIADVKSSSINTTHLADNINVSKFINDSDYATKAYADSLVTSVFRPAGDWDASGNTFPITGTGPGDTIRSGDTYNTSVAGTPSGFETLDVGDNFYALIDNPGQTPANWKVFESNTQQATESFRGTAKIATQAIIENVSTTNNIDIVTPSKFYLGWEKIKTIGQTFLAKITFAVAPRFNSGTANTLLYLDSNKDLTSSTVTPTELEFLSGIDSNIQDQIDIKTENSAGAISGFGITNNGNGTVNITSGVALLRIANTPTATLIKYPIPAVTNLALTDNVNNYVLVDYNGGTPAITVTTSPGTINTTTNSLIYVISRVGNTLDYVPLVGQNVDSNAKLRRRFLNSEGLRRASGAVLTGSNRNLIVTAGLYYSGLIEVPTPAFNTATTETFTQVYESGSTWIRTTGNTQINNTQYNNAGVLTNMPTNDYRVDYVYILANNPSKLYVILGNTTYANITNARLAPVPANLPSELQAIGTRIGRVIIQRLATTMEVSSEFATVYNAGSATLHNDLGGLNSGDFQHLTAAEKATVEYTTNKSNTLTASSVLYPNNNAVISGLSVKANDSEVLHKTGNEEVEGVKYFKNTVHVDGYISQGLTYTAFGDSYTEGVAASSSPNRFTDLFAAKSGYNLINQGVSGSMIGDRFDAVYNNADRLNKSVYTYYMGTNDMVNFKTENQRNFYKSGHLEQITFLGLPRNYQKARGEFTLTGTWSNYANNIYTISSNITGSTAQAVVKGNNIFVSYLIEQGNLSTFNLYIDEVLQGTYGKSNTDDINTGLGSARMPQLISVKVPEGTHTVRVQVASVASGAPIYINWMGGNKGVNSYASCRVLTANFPYWATYYNGVNNTLIDWYNEIVKDNVLKSQYLGVNVAMADVHSSFDKTTDFAPDGLHPNDTGMLKISNELVYANNSLNGKFQNRSFDLDNILKNGNVSPETATISSLTLNQVTDGTGSGSIQFRALGLQKWNLSTLTNNDLVAYNANTDSYNFTIKHANGFFGINNNSPSEQLDVVGNVKASEFIAPSIKLNRSSDTGTIDKMLVGYSGDGVQHWSDSPQIKTWLGIDTKANLASPDFTGTPTAPTASPGTNTTQIATTAFVTNAIGSLGTISGTYTPTLTSITNAASLSLISAYYTKIGDIVEVTVNYSYSAVSGSSTTNFSVTLPFNRTNSGNSNMIGNGVVSCTSPDFNIASLVSYDSANVSKAIVSYRYSITNSATLVGSFSFKYSTND